MPADFVETVEDVPMESDRVEPVRVEPTRVEPVRVEPVRVEPIPSEPISRTIHLMRAPLPPHVLHRLIRPKFKYWHFQFHEKEEERLLSLLRSLESGLTVLPNFKGGKDHPDLTLYRGEESVGKIQFIHLNRSDLGTPSKYYMDAYISCTYATLFDKVEDALFRFVEAWSVVPKTRKQRRHRRKTRKYKN